MILGLGLAHPSEAARNPATTCQLTIDKAAATLVQKTIKAEQACLKKLEKGRLPLDTRCVGEGGSVSPITHEKTKEKIVQLRNKARRAIDRRCTSTGVDLLSAPPDGLGFPVWCQAIEPSCSFVLSSSLQARECVICTHIAAANYLVRIAHPSVLSMPSATPTPRPNPSCGDATHHLTLTTDAGDYDRGWTGISHDGAFGAFRQLEADLCCAGNVCVAENGYAVGSTIGGPQPLSSGGVPICVQNVLREPIVGTYDLSTGCGDLALPIEARVFLEQDIGKPCPLCIGDATPNDGARSGTCEGGTAQGSPCDVHSLNASLGPTSVDCPPAGSSVGEINIDLDLTTGTAAVSSSRDCIASSFEPGSCYCPDQLQPNSCTDRQCVNGSCPAGPIDGVCSSARHRSCRIEKAGADCRDIFPGAGGCIAKTRPCFGPEITRTGQCGTSTATWVSAGFCLPTTRAVAINTTTGLPGPGALTVDTTVDIHVQ